MAAGELQPRWGQPLTGIISLAFFTVVAWVLWFLFSDPRGPVGWFPYPFVMYLAVMILVGIWQHMLLGDWPFQKIPHPARGVILTIMNLVITWFTIDVVFYRILGTGFNFVSYYGLEAAGGKPLFAQVAVVGFVLIGFYTFPVSTIFFGKWPVQPSNLDQPRAGFAEFAWGALLTLICYSFLIVPFFGSIFKETALAPAWWTEIGGTSHVHWVFGWWEWAIVILFMTPNVWRMKPWSLITLPQPWKGIVSVIISFIGAFALMYLCKAIIPMWIPEDVLHHLKEAEPATYDKFFWIHSAEIAGFTLIPFLIWHHYFDDAVFGMDKDGWLSFMIRTMGVVFFGAISYWFFYFGNFGHWGLGNHHMTDLGHRFAHGESLIWNFWWIIPLLWNEWFFHKWPFYVHKEH